MKKQTTIIFDFDSTLAESLPQVKKIFLEIAKEMNFKQISEEMMGKLIKKEVKETLKELKVPIFKLPKIEKLFRQKMKMVIKKIKPFPKIKETISELKKEGYSLGILSSNSQENVLWFLKKYELSDYFDFVDGGSGFFGKARKIKKLLKKNKFKRDEVVYIGDETRDIIAAQKNKIRVISVTWGVNPREVLIKYQPDWLADNPKELLKILSQLD
jgi:phosphoglycolate phosphatase